jgi:mono/diheme cytochrome c family protein
LSNRLWTLALACALAAGCGGGGSKPATTGAEVFGSAGCANCHTLKAAGANGRVGPNLDDLRPTAAKVRVQVTNGGGGMPPFKGTLSAAQIRAVADYVAKSTGG